MWFFILTKIKTMWESECEAKFGITVTPMQCDKTIVVTPSNITRQNTSLYYTSV